MRRFAFLAAVACLCSGVLTGTGRAGFIITFSQDGANVDANGTGTLNTTALSLITGTSAVFDNPEVLGNPAFVDIGGAFLDPAHAYTGFTGPAAIGGGTTIEQANTTSGDPVALNNGFNGLHAIFVPSGYISGSQLMDSMTFDNTTISGLGLTPGTYTYTWGSAANGTADFLTIQISPAATPEPASLTLLGLGVASLAGYAWRRRR
jgi:hypothetical protein